MNVPVGISTVVGVLTVLSAGIAAVITGLEGAGAGVPLTLSIIAGVVAAVLSVVRSWQANTLAIYTEEPTEIEVSEFIGTTD